jgi:hypothetical protein
VDDSLAIALGISAIGMTLLFLALGFFYILLTLMTAVIKDRPSSQAARAGVQDGGTGEEEARLRAAAVAVALARAEAEQEGPGSVSPAALGESDVSRPVSPWWALHHQRKLTPNSDPRRAR